MATSLENILMHKADIKYKEASKVVAECRDLLRMKRFDPSTDELQADCERRLGLTKRSKMFSGPIDIDETSFSDSESSSLPCFEDPISVTRRDSTGDNETAVFSEVSRTSSIVDDFFGRSTSTSTPTKKSKKASMQSSDVIKSNFFGLEIADDSTSRRSSGAFSAPTPPPVVLSVNENVPVALITIDEQVSAVEIKKDATPDAENKAPKTNSSKKTRKIKAEIIGIPIVNGETRENHLNDPTNRSISLEALMLRRFDLKYEDAACLVADARSNLNASKWEPWTDELYSECEKLYEIAYGPNVDMNMLDDGDIWSPDDSDVLMSLEGNPVLRAPKNEDYASIGQNLSDCGSIGWQSTSGWSSVWSDNDGDFSVCTHDKDDEYSVNIIKGLQINAEIEQAEIATLMSRQSSKYSKSEGGNRSRKTHERRKSTKSKKSDRTKHTSKTKKSNRTKSAVGAERTTDAKPSKKSTKSEPTQFHPPIHIVSTKKRQKEAVPMKSETAPIKKPSLLSRLFCGKRSEPDFDEARK
jgi:hypothetical protein